MPFGNLQNYQGSIDGIDEIVIGGNKFVKVFVDATAAQRTDGDVVLVSYVKSASSADYPNVRQPATTAVAVRVGVMATWSSGIPAPTGGSGGAATFPASGKTPAGSYGWAQIKGYCPKIAVTASLAAEHYIKAANASFIAVDDAAANQDAVTGISAKSFAITKTTDSGATGFTDGVILDREVTI